MQRSGSNLVYAPNSLASGQTFALTVLPEANPGGDSLRSWFESKVASEGAQMGTLTNDAPVTPQANGTVLSTIRGFKMADGSTKLVAFFGIQRPGGKVQMARLISTPNKELFQEHLKPAMKVVVGLTGAGGTGVASSSVKSTGKTYEKKAPRPDKRDAYRTKPGAGIPASQIEGLFNNQTMQMGVGGYMYMVYEPVLVLKDGTYCEDVNMPPNEMNIAAYRQERPKAWGKWKKVSGQYMRLDSKGNWVKTNWKIPLIPGKPGEKLQGTYSHLGGGGNTAFGGGTMIAVSNSFTFFPDGTFKDGRSVGASSHNEPMGTSVVTSSKGETDGTYKIDGNCIEFRYKDGRVDRRSYYWPDNKDKNGVYLNGTMFLLDKKDRK